MRRRGFTYKSGYRIGAKTDAKGQRTEYWYEDDLQVSGFPAVSRRLREIRKFPAPGVTEDTCQRVEMFYDGAVPTDGDWGVTCGWQRAIEWDSL